MFLIMGFKVFVDYKQIDNLRLGLRIEDMEIELCCVFFINFYCKDIENELIFFVIMIMNLFFLYCECF